MDFLALGCTNQEISRFLGISVNTVKIHVAAVYRTLDVSNRTEAVHRYGILTSRDTAGSGSPPLIVLSSCHHSPTDTNSTQRLDQFQEMIGIRLAGWRRFAVATTPGHPEQDRFPDASYFVSLTVMDDASRTSLGVRLSTASPETVCWGQWFHLRASPDLSAIEATASHVVAVLTQTLQRMERASGEVSRIASSNPWRACLGGLHLLESRSEAHWRESLDAFESAATCNPRLGIAHFGIAMANYIAFVEQWDSIPEGCIETIHRHAQECIRIEPSNPDALFALALSRLFEGRLDESLVLAQESVRVNPCSIPGHDLLGQLHALRGTPADGIFFHSESTRLSEHTAGYGRRLLAFPLIRFAEADFEGAAAACHVGRSHDGCCAILLAIQASAAALAGDLAQASSARIALTRIRPNFRIEGLLPLLSIVGDDARTRFLDGWILSDQTSRSLGSPPIRAIPEEMPSP